MAAIPLFSSALTESIVVSESTPPAPSSSGLNYNEVQLVSKPNTTSPVWKYFALEVNEKEK